MRAVGEPDGLHDADEVPVVGQSDDRVDEQLHGHRAGCHRQEKNSGDPAPDRYSAPTFDATAATPSRGTCAFHATPNFFSK
jgi:hypothetical protein